MAKLVTEIADASNKTLQFAYDLNDSLEDKITAVAKRIYGADGVTFAPKAKKALAALNQSPAAKLPVCIAKTQYSLSDNAALTGRPVGFTVTVRDAVFRAGAGFTVAMAGDILLMPGLPVEPNAQKMTINNSGVIRGLF